MKTQRPIIVAAVMLGAVLFSATTAEAARVDNIRQKLREETTLLRQSLYGSPDLHVARSELLRTTREWSAIRHRLVGTLDHDPDYSDLQQKLWTAELELREIAEWAPGGDKTRVKAALRVLNIKQEMRKMERAVYAGDPQLAAARQAMVDARSDLKQILDDIRYRLHNDQRLAQLRKNLRAAV